MKGRSILRHTLTAALLTLLERPQSDLTDLVGIGGEEGFKQLHSEVVHPFSFSSDGLT